MARKYDRERYLELVAKIKKAMPNASLTTDIIVGFPNETDEQFEETLSLYREVEFDSVVKDAFGIAFLILATSSR